MESGMHASGRVIRKNDTIVIREEFDDWALLFDPDTGKVCGVNPVGVMVWKWIDGRRTEAEICRLIREEYPDAPDSVDEDVAEFMDEIAEKGYATVQ
jgi:SynChlorMet cassette protein ScmD